MVGRERHRETERERERLESLLKERLSKHSPSKSSLFTRRGEGHLRFKLAFLGPVRHSFIKPPLNSALKHLRFFSFSSICSIHLTFR